MMPSKPANPIDAAIWIDAREAALLLGRNRDHLTRDARRTLQARGLARLAKGQGGRGVASWWLHRSLDPRLAYRTPVETASTARPLAQDRDVLPAIDQAAFALGSVLDALRLVHVPRQCEPALKSAPAAIQREARRMIGELHALRAGVMDHLIGNVNEEME